MYKKKQILDPIRRFKKKSIPIEIEYDLEIENLDELINKTEKENNRINEMRNLIKNSKYNSSSNFETIEIPKKILEDLKNQNEKLKNEIINLKLKNSLKENKIAEKDAKIFEIENLVNSEKSENSLLLTKTKKNQNEIADLKYEILELQKKIDKNKINSEKTENSKEEIFELKNELERFKNKYFQEAENLTDIKSKFINLQNQLNKKDEKLHEFEGLLKNGNKGGFEDVDNSELVDNLIYDYEMLSHIKEEWDGMIVDLSKYA